MKNKLAVFLLAMLVFSVGLLGTSLIPVQAAGATYYVATNGSDSNPGTSAQPFLTIQKAADLVNPGDTVIIRSGTYTVSSGAFPSPISADPAIYIHRSGSAAGGYIVFKSEVPGGAKIVSTGGYDVILINANYIEINGLDVSGGGVVGGHCIESENSHHTRIINGRFHDCGGAGIGANYGDYYHFEGNVTYNNANTNSFATSGISIYQARAISDNAPGFHNIIRNNISYNNIEFDTGTHTDGNGIIIDDFQNTQNGSTAGNYPYQTLVENNLTFYNGAKGIVVYLSDNVVVRNNTVFWNNRDNLNDSTWRGEINISMSSNITVANNIVWANPAYNSFNTAIVDAAYDDYPNAGNIWQNNLLFNGTVGNNSIRVDINGETSAASTTRLNQILAASANNRFGVNPLFINPGISGSVNFRLQPSSPAINVGTNSFGLPTVDLDGNARVIGSAVDLGAYEFGGSAVPTATPFAYTATPLPTPTPTATATFTAPDNSTLSAQSCTNSGTINLTNEGTVDWAHWGTSDWATSSVFDHKANVTPQISVGLPEGYSAVRTRRAAKYDENASLFSWSDGTPTSSATALDTGLYISRVGEGFRITAKADATPRTFKVYMGVYGAQARVTATLNTKSYTDTSIANTTDSSSGCYSFTYTGHSGTTNPQFLAVDIVVEADYLFGGNVTLQAATLSLAPLPPTATPTNTATNTPVPTSTPTLTATPSVDNSSINAVTCTNTGTINLTNEGTQDWAHWGRVNATTFDHKAGITQKISAGLTNGYTALNGASVLRYANNPSSFSWTDGTPAASNGGTPSGIYVTGLNRGLRITVPADTTTQTAKIYMGLWGAQARVTATLNTKTYSDTSVANTTSTTTGCYSFTYKGTANNQTMTIDILVNADYKGGIGNITLQAATLLGTVTPPTATPTHTPIPPTATLTPTSSVDNSSINAVTCTNSGTINLTNEGTLDWAHWGRVNATTFDHKASVTQRISTGLTNGYSVLNGGSALSYFDNASSFTWTDGTPAVNNAGTTSGIYVAGLNKGVRITVPADTTTQTVKVYMGVWNAQARVTATLNTKSYTDTSIVNTLAATAGCYSFTYTGSASGQTMTIDITVNADYNGSGNITLQAATLSSSATLQSQAAPVIVIDSAQSASVSPSAMPVLVLTNTSVPPTQTSVLLPTSTLVLPTNTSVPPTQTSVPLPNNTLVPAPSSLRIEAESFAAGDPGIIVGITSDPEGGNQELQGLENGRWVAYNDIDFGAGIIAVTVRGATDNASGQLVFRAGSPMGTPFCTVNITSTGGWTTYGTLQAGCSGSPVGIQTLYITVENFNGINMNWIEIVR